MKVIDDYCEVVVGELKWRMSRLIMLWESESRMSNEIRVVLRGVYNGIVFSVLEEMKNDD
jgi:hypothetical protein